MPASLSIIRTALADARDILDLQKLAYQSEAAIYQDYAIAPLVQTLAEMEAEFRERLVLKAVSDGRIVGSVRAHLQEGTCHIGRLIVHPEYQNQGLGTALMAAIEGSFPQASRYALFTGHHSRRNLYLYNKLGYQRIGSDTLSDKLTLIFLEKSAPANLHLTYVESDDDPENQTY